MADITWRVEAHSPSWLINAKAVLMVNADDPFVLSPVAQSVTPIALRAIPGAAAPAEKTAEEKRLEQLYSTSASYDKNIERWLFFLRSYEGGPDYVGEDTLFKHMREDRESYNDRLDRAVYLNYCKGLVDFVPEFIFQTPVNRVPGPAVQEEFKKFEINVDRNGTHIDQFYRGAAEEARIYGLVWIGADKPKVPEGEKEQLSVQRAQELAVDMPYLFVVRPPEVLDVIVDEFGRPEYFKRISRKRQYADGGVTEFDIITQWTPAEVITTTIDVTDQEKKRVAHEDRLPNPWKAVPFVPLLHQRSKADKDDGISFLQDIAYQNRTVFNYTSLLEEFLSRQGYSFLAVETSARVPTRGDATSELGTSNVMEVPEGIKYPAYVTPPVDPAQFIQSERAALIVEMYRQAAQDLATEVSATPASGDSLRQKFGRSIPVISRMADNLHQCEQEVLRLWAKMLKKDWADGRVTYRSDYSAQSLMSMILELSAVLNNLKVLSPTFIREEWMRIIRELDGRIPRETMEAIRAEIDAISDETLVGYYQAPAPQASVDAPAMGDMMQGAVQEHVGSDKGLTALNGSKASTKEKLPDAQRRSGPAGKSASEKRALK